MLLRFRSFGDHVQSHEPLLCQRDVRSLRPGASLGCRRQETGGAQRSAEEAASIREAASSAGHRPWL